MYPKTREKMFNFVALVTFAALASAASLPKDSPLSLSGRIKGGEDTTIEEAPYQVSLKYYGDHSCGGAIISEYYVLTAAQCIGGATSNYLIQAGSTDRTWGGSEHHVASVVRHENYSTPSYSPKFNDIALVRVVEPFKFDETRKPIALFNKDEETPVGVFSIITGWGSDGGWGLPYILQTVSVPIVSKQECKKGNGGRLPDGQICAAFPEGGKGACLRDSGTPLVVNGRLAGIMSYGDVCRLNGQPGVYTEVAAFRAWIKANSGV